MSQTTYFLMRSLSHIVIWWPITNIQFVPGANQKLFLKKKIVICRRQSSSKIRNAPLFIYRDLPKTLYSILSVTDTSPLLNIQGYTAQIAEQREQQAAWACYIAFPCSPPRSEFEILTII